MSTNVMSIAFTPWLASSAIQAASWPDALRLGLSRCCNKKNVGESAHITAGTCNLDHIPARMARRKVLDAWSTALELCISSDMYGKYDFY